jgi:PBSX family phage terminase large subunit
MSTSAATGLIVPDTVEAAQANPLHRFYQPFGGQLELLRCRDRQVLVEGPANTGKSRAVLEKVHAAATKYPTMRAAIVRRTRKSLTQSAMVTYEQKVIAPADSVQWRTQEQEYRYPNGSRVVIAGLDNPEKLLSSEYDLIYVQEAIEVTEAGWEYLDSRLRNHVMPYQQILGCCNPSASYHWLNQRALRGRTTRIRVVHEDNPSITEEDLQALRALSGIRRVRLYEGKWANAEGTVHPGWNPEVHVVDREIPDEWTRFWAIDFGFTNPFVWQEWAEDGDGRLYLVRELYHTRRLVEDHARHILRLTAESPAPSAIICDHDAEGRATLERYLQRATQGAHKAVQPGLQAVDARLQVAKDGLPRLFMCREALVERDFDLSSAHRPCSTEEEMDAYVWATSVDGRPQKEEPIKEHDHGNDAMRYIVAHRDLRQRWGAV